MISAILPRIFELISADGGRWTAPEAVFGKLSYGQWETWPPDERQAIASFFETLWSNVLDHFPHAFSAEACAASPRSPTTWRAILADDALPNRSCMRSISPRLNTIRIGRPVTAGAWTVGVEGAAGAGRQVRLAARSRSQDRNRTRLLSPHRR
jgi:hypothetical protein